MVMFILITFSGIMASRISAMEEQECWNTLEQTAQYTTAELRNMVNGDQDLLERKILIVSVEMSLLHLQWMRRRK